MVRGDRKPSQMGVAYSAAFKCDLIMTVKSGVDGGQTVREAIQGLVDERFVTPSLNKRERQNAVRDKVENLRNRYYETLRSELPNTVFADQEWYEGGTLPRPIGERVQIDPLADFRPAEAPRRGRPGKRAKKNLTRTI